MADEETLLTYGVEDDSFRSAAWKALQRDIGGILEILEARPEQPGDLSGIQYEGPVYFTNSRKPKWREGYACMEGHTISIYSSLGGKHKGTYKIAYAFTTRVDKEDQLIEKAGASIKQRIVLIGHGDIIQITGDSEDQTKAWLNVLRRMLKAKYTKEELKEKEEAKEALKPLLAEQQRLKLKQYQSIINTLQESGFFIEPKLKKEMEGHLELKRRGKEWKRLYFVLFKDYLYLFKPHEKISIDTVPYDWIEIQHIISVRPSKKQNCFVIRTVLRKFIVRAKHEIAVSEWVNAIRAFVEKKTSIPAGRMQVEYDDKGYHYTKSVSDRMSLVYIFEDIQKIKKLPKAKEHTIGRSSSNSVCLPDDKRISRAHCRIVVENNVPYIIDLGTNSGTLLNGTKITRHPLKPGDVIEIGKSKLIFEVKDGDNIFQMVGEPQSTTQTTKSKKKKKYDLIALEDSS